LTSSSATVRGCARCSIDRQDRADHSTVLISRIGTGKSWWPRAIHAGSRARSDRSFDQPAGIGRAAGERAVSASAGLVHGAVTARRAFSSGGRRTDLPGRDRRHERRQCRSSSSGPPGAADPPGRRDEETRSTFAAGGQQSDLDQMVRDRRFREDLLLSDQRHPDQDAALRDKRDDIPPCLHFLVKYSGRWQEDHPHQRGAIEHLLRHEWPGNVRELENVVERAVALETTDAIHPRASREVRNGTRSAPISRSRWETPASTRKQPRGSPGASDGGSLRARTGSRPRPRSCSE